MEDFGFDKLPPHDLEAEKCLLASMMLDQNVIETVVDGMREDYFYQADHTIIFKILRDMNEAGLRVDAITLRDQLRKRHLLDEVGGTAYLADIISSVPSAAHYQSYLKIVKSKAQLRGTIAVANEILRDCYAPMQDGGEAIILEKAQTNLEVLKSTGVPVEYRRIDAILEDFYDEKCSEKESKFVPTRIVSIDELIYGFPVPGFSVIAARASMGKSLFAKQCGKDIAAFHVPTLLVSVEEPETKIAGNAISSASTLTSANVFRDRWNKEQAQEAALAMNHFKIPFFVCTVANRISQICRVITEAVRKSGIKLAFVDHIHLVDPETPGNVQREQQVSQLSKKLKALSRRLNIHIGALAQLNKGGGGKENYTRRPMPMDLRDSGSLHEDADLLIMFHRTDYYHLGDAGYVPNNTIETYIHKQKYGGPGKCINFFDGRHSKIREWYELDDGPTPTWDSLSDL